MTGRRDELAPAGRLRDRAAAKRARAGRLTAAASRAADLAPGSFVTGRSGRSRAQNRASNRALDQTIDAAVASVALEAEARALELRARAIEQEPARRAGRERAKELERAQRAAVAALPILNDPAAPIHMTAAEWRKTPRDYKGVGIAADGHRARVRSAIRGGRLGEVFLTDKPPKPRTPATSSEP